MALTRKFLSAMGIEQEKIEQIIEAHTETVDALKADRDKYKEQAGELVGLKDELDKVKADYEKTKGDLEAAAPYKEKYDAEKKSFEDYKKDVDAARAKAKKADAYKGLLRKAGVSDKRFESIVKVAPLDGIELDDEGAVKDEDKWLEGIKSDWADFIVTEDKQGAKTETPPANTGGGKMSKEDILAIKDRNERQQAISDNHELFGY